MKKVLLFLFLITADNNLSKAQIFKEDFSGVSSINYITLPLDHSHLSWHEVTITGWGIWTVSTSPSFSYHCGTVNPTYVPFSYPGASNGYASMDEWLDEFDDYISLISPEINCTGQSQVFLSFVHLNRLCTASLIIHLRVYIVDSMENILGTYIVSANPANPVFDTLDISNSAAGHPDVHIEFAFSAGNIGIGPLPPGYWNAWVIDDVVLFNPSCNISNTMIHSSNPAVFCQGDSLELYHDSTAAGITFEWYKNGIPIAGANSSNYWAIDSGVYSCKITDTCGYVFSNYLPVIMHTPIGPYLIYNGSTTYCPVIGSPQYINLSPLNSSYSYQWYLNGVSLSNPYTSQAINQSGIYYSAITNSCGTFISDSVIINLLGPTAVIDTLPPFPVCYPDTFNLSVQAVPFGNYQWYRGNSYLPGDTNLVLTSNLSGVYTCHVTDTSGCTRVSNSIIANTNSNLSTIYASGPTTFCAGSSVVLNANNCTSCAFQWTKNGINIPCAAQPTFTATTAGSYCVFVIDSFCTVLTNPITVSVPCRPAPGGGSGSSVRSELNDSNFSEQEVILYPDPVSNEVNIYSFKNNISAIEIINELGQIVFKKKNNGDTNNTIIDVSWLARGIYFVKIATDKGGVVRKFVKE